MNTLHLVAELNIDLKAGCLHPDLQVTTLADPKLSLVAGTLQCVELLL